MNGDEVSGTRKLDDIWKEGRQMDAIPDKETLSDICR